MGLDMYMMAVEREEVHYWRKHNALHNWMEQKYREQGGTAEFNCVDFELNEELLDELEKDIREHKLEPTSGFFFGTTDYDPAECEEDDLAAIAKAREQLRAGKQIVYFAWY